ncbi:MAG TPA: TonB-dependent receptor [Woeseiaceae bacterium]|nr:TonB-dependent receptor [Woeseiaceae bacterium]
MCGQYPTNFRRYFRNLPGALLASGAILLATAGLPAHAQIGGVLEEITVTAQKREESLQDVPISVATISGERLNVLFSGSDDVLALSARIPGLYAESSNGRAAPRFYLRGLGNIDFDLAASQPVSFIMDDVVMENVVLKSFPLFDLKNVEVIRGPQGTLFGRNTTAGIVKINTMRPSQESSGYVRGSWATYDTVNVEGAVGGSLIEDKLAVRVSGISRTRSDWITNGYTGQKSIGDYDELAGRVQLLFTPSDQFSALLSYQLRNLDGTSSIFRANVFDTGSNSLNQNYDRETVYYDDGDDNPQGYDSNGFTANLQWDLERTTFTSITSYQSADGFSRGDIDAGVVDLTQSVQVPAGITFDPNAPTFDGPALTFPGTIIVSSVTQDGADTTQFTQEFRFASQPEGRFNWQVGGFYFDSDLEVTTESFASFGFAPGSQQDTIVEQSNSTWAVFGQGSYDLSDTFTVTAGVRYTEDEKDFEVLQFGQLWLDLGIPTFIAGPINVDDDQTSWELSGNWAISDRANLYGRYATGFRAQTIQGRDVAFLETPSVAQPETIESIELGYKTELLNQRMRLNMAVFMYELDDMQLSVIGGAANVNQVINAAKGEAVGFELDAEWLLTDRLLLTAGASWNDTEIKDSTLSTAPCGSGLCTPLDPVDPTDFSGRKVLLDGNPFPRAPETTYSLTLQYTAPVGASSELFFLTDWAYTGEINMPLYEAVEFKTDSQFEGGLRFGYRNLDSGWDVALFGRNITDEDNVLGFVDFSNNAGFVNEPRVWGIEFGYQFGE